MSTVDIPLCPPSPRLTCWGPWRPPRPRPWSMLCVVSSQHSAVSTLHLAHCITLLCLLCQVRREDTARLHHTGSISGCPVSGSEVHLRYYIIALDVNTGYHCSWVFVGSNTGNDWSCTTQSSVTCTCGKCLK